MRIERDELGYTITLTPKNGNGIVIGEVFEEVAYALVRLGMEAQRKRDELLIYYEKSSEHDDPLGWACIKIRQTPIRDEDIAAALTAHVPG